MKIRSFCTQKSTNNIRPKLMGSLSLTPKKKKWYLIQATKSKIHQGSTNPYNLKTTQINSYQYNLMHSKVSSSSSSFLFLFFLFLFVQYRNSTLT